MGITITKISRQKPWSVLSIFIPMLFIFVFPSTSSVSLPLKRHPLIGFHNRNILSHRYLAEPKNAARNRRRKFRKWKCQFMVNEESDSKFFSKRQEIKEENWQEKAELHRNRILDLLGGKLGLGGKVGYDTAHPIYNFIFEYYHFKPRRMVIDYTPGSGVILRGAKPKEDYLFQKNFIETEEGIYFCPSTLKPGRVSAFKWTLEFLKKVEDRPPVLFCYGLHEWAMLYCPDGAPQPKKHQSLPLRIGQQELNAVVESRTLRCTHFDAFRFFTQEARPLNQHELTRENQIDLDQPGCVHATMDLFKWALKLLPFCPSKLLGDCLELALKARVLDIRASPYDAVKYSDHRFDLSPIQVENADGRKVYQQIQQDLWLQSIPLRRMLIEYYEKAIKDYENIYGCRKPQNSQNNYDLFR